MLPLLTGKFRSDQIVSIESFRSETITRRIIIHDIVARHTGGLLEIRCVAAIHAPHARRIIAGIPDILPCGIAASRHPDVSRTRPHPSRRGPGFRARSRDFRDSQGSNASALQGRGTQSALIYGGGGNVIVDRERASSGQTKISCTTSAHILGWTNSA